MNDSFLEDLDLVPSDVKNVKAYAVDRHVTTRIATSSPLYHVAKSKGEHSHERIEQVTVFEKQPFAKEATAKELKKLSDQDTVKHTMKARISERKDKPVETKLKPIENKVKNDGKGVDMKDDTKVKIRETRLRSTENKVIIKERARRSGSCKENTQTLDVKENSRPVDSPKEGTSQNQLEAGNERTKTSEVHKKEVIKENDPTMLNTIKEIVSLCTKQESSRILRAMQELHFNSQANLIKHLLSQTDDIISEMQPNKTSSRMKSLMEMNEKLQEDNIILQKKNEELVKKLEQLDHLKQENIALKLKCKELLKQ